MKISIFLLFIILLFCCTDKKDIVGPDYNKVSIIAGKVSVSGTPAKEFYISVNQGTTRYWMEEFENSSGNYTMYINAEGTFSVTALVEKGGTYDSKTEVNVKLELGEIKELNFEF